MRSKPRPGLAAIHLAAALCPFTSALAQTGNRPPEIVTGTVEFEKQVLDETVDQTHAVAVADFDGDGLLDVVATDFHPGEVIWYRNDGRGGFVRNVLDDRLWGAYPVGVGDVDLDGDVDVLAGGYTADLLVWYENDGSGVFARHDIDSTDGPHSVVTGDIDRDGDNDLLTSSQAVGNIAWYENDGQNNFTLHIIDARARGAKRAELADLDGDGDLDAVAASFYANEVAWYENDGQQSFTKHILDDGARGAYYVFPVDLDRDGDADVLAASQLTNAITCYENLGSGNFSRHVVDESAAGARTVIAADIDGDGFADPLGVSVDDDTLAWHASRGCWEFTEQAIDLEGGAAYGACAIDMDGDGDIDVLAANRDSDSIVLHTQRKRHEARVTHGGRRVIDVSILQAIDADDGPAELVYTVTDAPDFGTLELDGSALPVGGSFTQDDVDRGSVHYVHGGSGSAADSLAFTLQDGGENGVRPGVGDLTVIVTGTGNAVVELSLDEGNGTVAGDVSGNGNNGTLVDGPVFETNTTDCSTFAVRFDGENDYIDLGALDPGGSGLTLSIWLNADDFPGASRDPRLISKASGLAADSHVFMLSTIDSDESTRLRGRIRIGGKTTTLVASRGDLGTGVWHHAAMTYDGMELRLYLDGIEVGTTPLTGDIDMDGNTPVAVGGQPPGAGSRYFDGLLDDVRIFERGLHASEIAALASGYGGFRSYGAWTAGSRDIAPRLAGSGCLRLRKDVSIDVSRGLPGALGALFFGGAKSAVSVVGGWLLLDPQDSVSVPMVLSSSGHCVGSASLPVTVPDQPSLIGVTIYCQGLFFDPGAPAGISFTEGLEMVIGG